MAGYNVYSSCRVNPQGGANPNTTRTPDADGWRAPNQPDPLPCCEFQQVRSWELENLVQGMKTRIDPLLEGIGTNTALSALSNRYKSIQALSSGFCAIPQRDAVAAGFASDLLPVIFPTIAPGPGQIVTLQEYNGFAMPPAINGAFITNLSTISVVRALTNNSVVIVDSTLWASPIYGIYITAGTSVYASVYNISDLI